jgi:signal transduction histidine kinase
VKFKAWIGASFVLILALAGTTALFYYQDQVKSESVQMLQNRLNEIELQRFEEDKGAQVQTAAKQASARFDKLLSQRQQQMETLADGKVFRKAAAWGSKKKSLLQSAKKHTYFINALLTNEKGAVQAWTQKKKPLTSIAPTPAFKEASQLRKTAIHFIEQAEGPAYLQFTIPCLSDRGSFLGVLQAQVAFTQEDMKKVTPKGGFKTIVTTNQGQRLSKGPSKSFPKNLGALLNKNLSEMETLLRKPSTERYQAKWENNSYILVCTPTQISKIKLFTVLEVLGIERVVGSNFASTSILNDPIILVGLIGIVFLSLLLMFFFSGGSLSGVKKVNRQLLGMLQTGESLQYVEAPSGGEWEKLTDLINQMVERVQTGPTNAGEESHVGINTEEAERTAQALNQMKAELEDLHKTYDQALVQNQELGQKIEEATERNQELNQSLETAQAAAAAVPEPEAPAPTTDDTQVQTLLDLIKEEGSLRIEAISSMSDDLKSTLMVIKNYISSILSSEEGKITDTQQEFLGVVINKSARLERQINDLLDISHMESGVLHLFRSKTDLVSMIQDVVLNSQPQADTKQVKITQEIQTTLPPVMIDSDRLGQVFITLVQHAVKITPVGGEVFITGTETMTDMVVKIKDGGEPLDSQQSETVFSEFHGSDSNAGPDIAGTGLRFPIIRRILSSHQGTVTTRGLPDKGNETVVALSKTDELIASSEPEPETASLERYEVKPVESEETPAAQTSGEEDASYDLTSFMGKMDEYEDSPAPVEPSESPILPGDDDLNKLLSDIENIDDKM